MTLTTKSPGRWLWAIIVGVALCVSAPPPATAEDCADNCPENSWIVPNTGIPKIDIVMGADSRRARLTGTDMAGTVTAPVGMTGCWVRFAKPFKNPPVCVGSFSSGQADLSVVGGGGATVSGRTLTVWGSKDTLHFELNSPGAAASREQNAVGGSLMINYICLELPDNLEAPEVRDSQPTLMPTDPKLYRLRLPLQ